MFKKLVFFLFIILLINFVIADLETGFEDDDSLTVSLTSPTAPANTSAYNVNHSLTSDYATSAGNSGQLEGRDTSTLVTYLQGLYDLVFAPITEPLSLHLNQDNWAFGDNWNYLTGTNWFWNQSKLDELLLGDYWFFTTDNLVYGTSEGSLTDTQQYDDYDDVSYNLTEAVPAGLEYYANTSANVSTDVNKICIRYISNGDDFDVSIWDIPLNDWEGYMTLTSNTDFAWICADIRDSVDHLVDDKIMIKIVDAYQASTQHKLYIDAIYVSSGYTPRVGNEVDPIFNTWLNNPIFTNNVNGSLINSTWDLVNANNLNITGISHLENITFEDGFGPTWDNGAYITEDFDDFDFHSSDEMGFFVQDQVVWNMNGQTFKLSSPGRFSYDDQVDFDIDGTEFVLDKTATVVNFSITDFDNVNIKNGNLIVGVGNVTSDWGFFNNVNATETISGEKVRAYGTGAYSTRYAGFDVTGGGLRTITSDGYIYMYPDGELVGYFVSGSDAGFSFYDNKYSKLGQSGTEYGIFGLDGTYQSADTILLMVPDVGYDSDGSRTIIIGDIGDRAYNFDHAPQPNPTIFLHSATNPDTDNTQWMSFAHDTSDAIITSGSGTHKFYNSSGYATPIAHDWGTASPSLNDYDGSLLDKLKSPNEMLVNGKIDRNILTNIEKATISETDTSNCSEVLETIEYCDEEGHCQEEKPKDMKGWEIIENKHTECGTKPMNITLIAGMSMTNKLMISELLEKINALELRITRLEG